MCGSKTAVFVLGVLGFAMAVGLLCLDGSAAPVEVTPRAIPVVVAPATRGELPVYLTGSGRVRAFETAVVRSRIDGELVHVAFDEGQTVEAGDLVAEIDRRPYEVQLAREQGRLAKDAADREIALLTLRRLREAPGSRAEISTAAALVSSTEAALELDRGAIESAKVDLLFCRIVAPIAGRIGLRRVDPGSMVHPDGRGIAVITRTQPIAVVFALPVDEAAHLATELGRGVGLLVECYDRDLRVKLATGRLVALGEPDAKNTVEAEAVFANRSGRLVPNESVSARILLGAEKDAVLVPEAAVQRETAGAFVYVAKRRDPAAPSLRVERRRVVSGPREGGWTAIESGLDEGETVVIEGADELLPGSLVAANTTNRR